MIFKKTSLKGVFVIEPEMIKDERGFFARIFCQNEFAAQGVDFKTVQCSISYNKHKGTLRGMHYQVAPKAESKIVRCTKGAIYDVAIDMRHSSPTYRQWTAVELTQDNRRMIHIPKGFAHGFQTLEDDSEVIYRMDEVYAPEYARGARWDDPAFKIKWPLKVKVISERDANYPLINDA